MKNLRTHKYLFALLALLVVFAACKGESPTAPQPTGGGGGNIGGGGTPPSGATIALSVSNATPLIDSSTVITATVTLNGQPVPNGTAVEFHAAPLGTFTDTGTAVTIKTTTNGIATATLTSTSPGTTTVTAIVNNVSKQAQVVFQAQPVTPPPPVSTVTITGVVPNNGSPSGGLPVTITGTNFTPIVRVLFDLGGGQTREAFVASVAPTQIQVLTPQIDLGAGQTKVAGVIVITNAGTTNEQRVTAAGAFTYRRDTLTPTVVTISPDSGPIGGGTRITIFGDGFEAPAQVSFGTAGIFSQMQVVNVTFNQIIAVTPPARDVMPNGSGTLTGPVDLRIININSGTKVTLDNAFRYTPKMQITAIGPTTGPSIGGTDVTIDGIGFDDPVTVTIGGAPAQVLRVSGTQILARTSGLASPCGTATAGPVVVTNVNNGDSASSAASFTYIAITPTIVSVVPSAAAAGTNITVTVLNPGIGPLGSAIPRFTINGVTVVPSPNIITVGTGTQAFTVIVPTPTTFPTETCTTTTNLPGTRLAPLAAPVDVVFTNATTTCTDTFPGALTIQPPLPNTCVAAAPAQAQVTAPAVTACPGLNLGSTAVAGGTASGTITVKNNAAAGSQSLTVTPASNNAQFTVSVATVTVVPQGTANITVTFDPSAVGAQQGTITLTTNDPLNPTITVCVTGTGT